MLKEMENRLEEIITIAGRQYKLMTDYPLTDEQRQRVIADIARQTGCSTCGTKSLDIQTLATCNVTSKVVGQTISLSAQPHGGVAPYTVKFYKGLTEGATQIGTTTTGVTENQLMSYSYPLVVGDVGTQIFSVHASDSCISPQTCIDQCTITIAAQVLTTITITPASPPAINIGSTVTLSAACYDQVGNPMPSCGVTWSSANSSIATVSAGLVTGVAGGSTTITATIGSVSKSVTVVVNCNSISCGFVVS